MTQDHHLILQPGALSLNDLRAVWGAHGPLTLAPAAYAAIETSAATVQAIVAKGDPAYGINTGFGILAKRHIPQAQLEQLQQNLILSHAVGTGELLPDNVVRLILLTKIGSLARGYSGVRPLIVDREAYGDGVADVSLDGAYDIDEQIDDEEIEAAGEFE